MNDEKQLICFGGRYEDCTEKAVFVRHTQFAGSHPLCDKHAREEKDFMINDTYTDWEELNGDQ